MVLCFVDCLKVSLTLEGTVPSSVHRTNTLMACNWSQVLEDSLLVSGIQGRLIRVETENRTQGCAYRTELRYRSYLVEHPFLSQ